MTNIIHNVTSTEALQWTTNSRTIEHNRIDTLNALMSFEFSRWSSVL